MDAILLSCGLIIYWMFLGLGFQACFKATANFHLRVLVAPAIGLAMTTVTLFTVSRLGFPIKTVAMPIFLLGLCLIAYFGLTKKVIWKRPSLYLLLFFMLFAVVPFVSVLFTYGFDWLAMVNGDMSFYSLSASRFLDYGYAELPASGNIFDVRDHSLAYWFFPNVLGHRMGADLLLAQMIGLTGLTAHQVFMPLIIAFHACVVAGAGALTLLGSRRRSLALWTMVLVGLSPMLTLEVTMQLLAQAIGLAVLTSLCVAYVQAVNLRGTYLWKITAIVLVCALAIAYSEVLPFFALFVLIYEFIGWKSWTDKRNLNYRLCSIGMMIFGSLVLLNTYSVDVVKFILLALDGSMASSAMTMKANGLSLFPQFLLPSGAALFWGWLPFGIPDDSFSGIILFALAALFIVIVSVLMMKKRSVPSASMVLVMLVMAAFMYVGGNGFGVFKLAMFIQPFMLSTVVILLALFFTKKILQYISLALLSGSVFPAQSDDIGRFSQDFGAQVPYASSSYLGKQLRAISDTVKSINNIYLYSDTTMREFFLLESYYFKGVPFEPVSLPASTRRFIISKLGIRDDANVFKLHQEKVQKGIFYFGRKSGGIAARFKVNQFDDSYKNYLLASSNEFSPINKSTTPSGKKLYIRPLRQLKNYLIFRSNSLGLTYVGANWDGNGVALWGSEKDPLFSGKNFSAINRYQLYRVMGAIDGSRVLLSMTASMNKADDFMLPTITIAGKLDVQLPLVGRGSARIVSATVEPRTINSADYLGINFGRDGSFQTVNRKGAMKLFGKNIKSDIRKFVGFARDISYISPAQYSSLERPSHVQSFPEDLAGRGLEYSGIFEDGWISDIAYVVLKKPIERMKVVNLRFAGMIPSINGEPFQTTLKISVNGHVVYSEQRSTGKFSLFLPVSYKFFQQRDNAIVQVESSKLQRLPNGDGRPVSLHIKFLGF